MNWYIIVGFVSSFLLGWAIGIWIGTTKGYAVALHEMRQRESQTKWSEYFKQINKEIFDLNKETTNEKTEN